MKLEFDLSAPCELVNVGMVKTIFQFGRLAQQCETMNKD
jgi:hypothetical protein